MGKNPNEIRICKNCSKEYTEKENFNWSCRIHQSEWGGEVWWCCGKRGQDQPGCKFQKHTWKKEEEELFDNEVDMLDKKLGNNKKLKCKCCGEIGHRIEDCTRDPNFKTNMDINEENERIRLIKDFRKMNSETSLQTLHLIKKATMLPLTDANTGKMLEA